MRVEDIRTASIDELNKLIGEWLSESAVVELMYRQDVVAEYSFGPSGMKLIKLTAR